ncbi:MAG: hypothetical protein WCG55_01435 [bacterium]
MIAWENMQLAAKVNHKGEFALDKKDRKLLPASGSELALNGAFLAPIGDFHKLAECLSGNYPFDPMRFLPRVPKELVGKLEQDKCVEILAANELLLFPFFVKRWKDGGKKVCEVKAAKKIPLIDPCEKAYIASLPYDDFIVTLDEPVGYYSERQFNPLFAIKQEKKVQNMVTFHFSTFIVSKSNGYLRVFGIPDDIERSLYPKEAIEKMEEMIRYFSQNKTKQAEKVQQQFEKIVADHLVPLFLSFRIDIATGKVMDSHPDTLEFEPIDQLSLLRIQGAQTKESWSGSNKDVLDFLANDWHIQVLTFLLNGIGKLFHDYVAPVGIKTYQAAPDIPEQSPRALEKIKKIVTESEPLTWFEVNRGGITYLSHASKKKSTTGFCIQIGNEKPPHPRRHHDRNYRDEFGNIVRKIHLKETWVHPHRKHEVIGSSMIIK